VTRHAVSVAIRSAEQPGRVLIVQRPPDDADLPDAWGLPAASMLPGESPADAVRRAGTGKLGVRLSVGTPLRSGSVQRAGYTLQMTLYDATIAEGSPAVPQPTPDVTQYADMRWGSAPDLAPAAAQGSLCCSLFLEHAGSAGG
jgi:8-oxo-dGTP pyrophosphatase MutT (NUDIX family)